METKRLLLSDRDKIRKKWGKTPSDVEEYIAIIKEWIKMQKHLPELPEDNMIEYVLTVCKYSIESSKQNLEMYYSMHQMLPEFFIHPLKHNLVEVVSKMGYIATLPNLDENLSRITMLKFHREGIEIFDPYKLAAYVSAILEIRLQEDLGMGEVLVCDAEHLAMGHVVKFTPSFFKKCTLLLEALLKNRLKGIHIINYPPYINTILAVAKMFLKKKIYDRIHLHTNIESLYKSIPREMLPIDYGGDEKAMKTIMDLWQLKLEQYAKRFDFIEKMEIKESLRAKPLMNTEVLGYYGNFKKLDVD
ncbi:unnamed protein product [Psylliodes chrysocephalus]|uniref:CRAL-TRIO domain-containing protein n=1 Tax=Psylliodes chrysocephalus TaxID=3402493 RepID=A0A9P0CU76_9CUCU|nr:unnamed protein product [Psylliodes chrysocephala]